ncbi:MAG: helix-turn-helix domain-containing protein, partial [Pseudomonadota bacterium]
AGRFRIDLFYRLNVVTIHVPPLRDRLEDMPALVHKLSTALAKKMGLHDMPVVEDAAMESLMTYKWPGNVRELKNLLERALILGNGRRITPEDLAFGTTWGPQATSAISINVGLPKGGSMNDALRDAKKSMLLEALRRTEGNVSAAARMLGITRDAFNYSLKSLGIRDE